MNQFTNVQEHTPWQEEQVLIGEQGREGTKGAEDKTTEPQSRPGGRGTD